MDFDLHGCVRVRLEGAGPREAAAVARQLGPIATRGTGEPDVTVRFVDRLETRGPVRLLGLDECGFSDDAFLVLRSKHKSRARVQIPMERIGERCEITCERGLPAVPLLVAIVNLTALTKGTLPLHAAAFEWNGAGVVVTGWSKGGKTETLLAFAQRGARYVADEWCYLASDGRRVFGLPEPLRIWRWQLAQLPEIERRLSRRERLRLAAWGVVPALDARLPERARRTPAGRALRRVAQVAAKQLHADAPAELLFGADAARGETELGHVVFAMSHEQPDTSVAPIDPQEVADRMLHSLHFERTPLLQCYAMFRFAFPELANPHLEKAPERERVLLQRWLAGRPCLRLLHPYPVELAKLFDALEPRLRPRA
jgi:hypothetical protein